VLKAGEIANESGIWQHFHLAADEGHPPNPPGEPATGIGPVSCSLHFSVAQAAPRGAPFSVTEQGSA
jgi:hypothetical protein